MPVIDTGRPFNHRERNYRKNRCWSRMRALQFRRPFCGRGRNGRKIGQCGRKQPAQAAHAIQCRLSRQRQGDEHRRVVRPVLRRRSRLPFAHVWRLLLIQLPFARFDTPRESDVAVGHASRDNKLLRLISHGEHLCQLHLVPLCDGRISLLVSKGGPPIQYDRAGKDDGCAPKSKTGYVVHGQESPKNALVSARRQDFLAGNGTGNLSKWPVQRAFVFDNIPIARRVAWTLEAQCVFAGQPQENSQWRQRKKKKKRQCNEGRNLADEKSDRS